MPDPAIGELMPDEFQVSEDFLDLTENPLNHGSFTCELEVIDMLRHDAEQDSTFVFDH